MSKHYIYAYYCHTKERIIGIGKRIHPRCGGYPQNDTYLTQTQVLLKTLKSPKYPKGNFVRLILMDDLTEDEVNDLEEHYIDVWKTSVKFGGTNIAPGGQGGFVLRDSPEKQKLWKERLREAAKYKRPATPEEIARRIATRRSNLALGITSPGTWTLSAETRRRQSEAQKGRVVSDETRKKLSKTLKGRPLKQSTKDKIGAAARRNGISAETRAKMVESRKRNGNYKMSESAKQRIGDAHRGRKRVFSQQHRENLSKAVRAAAVRKRREREVLRWT